MSYVLIMYLSEATKCMHMYYFFGNELRIFDNRLLKLKHNSRIVLTEVQVNFKYTIKALTI